MDTANVGQTTACVTGFVEFTEAEMPMLLTQSGRAGARLSHEESYLAVNSRFASLIQSCPPRALTGTLMELWEPACYARIRSAFSECQSQGPQMIRGCCLQSDPLQRVFDILFVSEVEANTVVQLLFEAGGVREPKDGSEELHRLRSIVDLAPVLISIKDRQGIIRLTNRLFAVLDGPNPEDYTDRSVFELFPPDVAAQLWKNDLAVFHSGQVVEAEETVRHRDGSEHTYLTYKYPLIRSSGEVVEVCAISTDITIRKYYEQQAFEAMRKAEEANRVKSDFLAHMSHEIRTPLTVIRGYADLIARKSGAYSATIRPWISSVQRASKQLELIINDILDLSKVEAGVIEMERYPVDLRQILQDLHQGFALNAQEKNLNFRIEIELNVPTLIVTDPLRLRQVLDNIVGNALKFTEEGFVTICVANISQTAEPLLQFLICDSGIGLSEEEQKKLFQPFVQADGSITRKFGGTGLGLVLARRLAQLLGGDVRIHRSAPRCGTEMLVIIPSLPARDAGLPRFHQGLPFFEGESSQKLLGRRLLIVEDAADIRDLLRTFLSQHGALVETANFGEEGLQHCEGQPFDAVLMDLQMPVLDGMQTMSAMRARGFKGVIMAVTAHALQGEREKCLNAGFDEFLSKPLHLPQVLDILEKMLTTKTAGPNPINSCHEP